MDPDHPAPPAAEEDPIVARRARIARLAGIGQSVGYALFGVAVVAFVVGFVVGFAEWAVSFIVVCLVAGSLVLAPSIVLGHAVHAANRADREGSW